VGAELSYWSHKSAHIAQAQEVCFLLFIIPQLASISSSLGKYFVSKTQAFKIENFKNI
jgi:hypothetical protein